MNWEYPRPDPYSQWKLMSFLEITCDDDAPIPRDTLLRLGCACGQTQTFAFGGYVENFSAAMEEGWLERQGAQGRIFLCPACSGKKGRAAVTYSDGQDDSLSLEPLEPTDQALIDQYFKIDKKLEELAEEFKKLTEPYKKGLTAIKGMLHERLNQRGAKHTSVDLSAGGRATCFKVNSMSVKCTDKAQYIRYCLSEPDWAASLLTANVSKDGLSDFMEKHTIQTENGPVERVPPGIEVNYFETVQVRRV